MLQRFMTAVGLAAALIAPGTALAGSVSAYPSPGDGAASRGTQISFRGVSADQVGRVVAIGSHSGRHGGTLRAHSDGFGASFVPNRPFATGELVRVKTDLPIRQSHRGDYSFRIGDFRAKIRTPKGRLPKEGRLPSRWELFHSRPALRAPAVEIVTAAHRTAPGYIFLAPKSNGPMIIDDEGNLVWYEPSPLAKVPIGPSDFRTQTYEGRPVLTYWQGPFNTSGYAKGWYLILDDHYRVIRRVLAGNGFDGDLHEFRITSRDTAYLTAYSAVRKDLRRYGGSRHGSVLDAIAQEIDLKTGLVLWEWHSVDHVSLRESAVKAKPSAKDAFDYFHINSVADDSSGNVLISGRATEAVYRVRKATGKVLWRLGGNHSSFKRANKGTRTVGQHDAVRNPDGTLTVFDNGYLKHATHKVSRGLILRLDPDHHRVRLERAFAFPKNSRFPRGLLAQSQGSMQMLPNGNAFIGWGSQPHFTEFSPSGEILFNARFTSHNSSYRTYRLPWEGHPSERPAIATQAAPGGVTAWASWNGDTEVHAWRLLGGPSPGELTPIGESRRTGFETEVTAGTAGPFVAMAGVSADGTELARTATVRIGARSR